MRILCGASLWRSACASVFTLMNSTPIISARIIRLTALLPPPPTPMTLMSAKFSESDRSGMSGGPSARQCGWSCSTRGLRRVCPILARPPGRRRHFFHNGAPSYPQVADRVVDDRAGCPRSDQASAAAGRSAGEQVPDPLPDARQRIGAVGAGPVADRLVADMGGPPQEQPDRRAEGGVADLVHQPADSLR